jgi:hypothetical protein
MASACQTLMNSPNGYSRVTQTLQKFRTLTDVRKTFKERYMSVKHAHRTLQKVGDTLDRRSTNVTGVSSNV